jgi:fibronectin type 3 domain-containing protein
VTKTVYNVNIPTQAMYVILSAGLDSTADATTGFPNYYIIDYFRWYQASSSVAPGTAPVIFTTSTASNKVMLTWAGVQGATGYKISRASMSGGPYTQVGTTSGINVTSFADTGVTNFVQYYYVVAAKNAYGNGPASAEVSAMPAPAPLSLRQPATASSYQSGHDPFYGNDGTNSTRWTASNSSFPQWWKVDLGSVQNVGMVNIKWENSAAWSFRYKIEVSTNDVNYTTAVDQTGRTVTGDSTDIFSASARYVRITVTGQNNGGWASFYECQVFGTTPPGPPEAPTALTPVAGDKNVALSWTQSVSPGITSNIVYRATSNGGPYVLLSPLAATTSYSDTTVTNGVTYYYVISAVNAGGESAQSGEASAHPVSNVPPQTVAKLDSNNLEISWPFANTGWRLQAQTNEPGAGLGTNWTDVADSIATNRMIFPIDRANDAVFYRLVYVPQ